MATRFKQIHQLHTLMILISLPTSFSAGNLKLIFDDIKCEAFNDYVKHFSCSVDKTVDVPLLNVDIQMKKEVQECRFDFTVHVKSVNRDPFTAFKAEGIRYCSVQARDKMNPVYMTFKDMLNRAGRLPNGCPIPADYHYLFPNISINTDFLPSYYAPKAGLKIALVYYNRKAKYIAITTFGRLISTKMRNKGRRH